MDWATWGDLSRSKKPDPEFRIAFISALSADSAVVDPATEPANPFLGTKASLYVSSQKPDDLWFRLVGRPFVEQSATQGTFEFEFRLVEGTISLSLGHCDQPWIPDDLTTYGVTKSKASISFAVDKDVLIRGEAYQTDSVTTLNAGENYRFTVKWDLNTPEGFAYFINGEPLSPLSNVSSPKISVEPPESGINAFRITLGGPGDHLGSVFLGRISARSAPVDLHSPEGLIGK